MHQAEIDFFRLLVQVGAVPGEDFSCDAAQQAYRLNERCYGLLQAAHPDINWHELLEISSTPDISEQLESLHERLGCPFVDNLIPRMIAQLRALPDDQAAGYVQTLLAGVEQATGISLYQLLVQELDMTGQLRLEWLLRQEVVTVPGQECLLDLLLAAGGQETDYEISEGELWFTEAGYRRLSLVWTGEYTLITDAPDSETPDSETPH